MLKCEILRLVLIGRLGVMGVGWSRKASLDITNYFTALQHEKCGIWHSSIISRSQCLIIFDTLNLLQFDDPRFPEQGAERVAKCLYKLYL
jgi:hypothetical protein